MSSRIAADRPPGGPHAPVHNLRRWMGCCTKSTAADCRPSSARSRRAPPRNPVQWPEAQLATADLGAAWPDKRMPAGNGCVAFPVDLHGGVRAHGQVRELLLGREPSTDNPKGVHGMLSFDACLLEGPAAGMEARPARPISTARKG